MKTISQDLLGDATRRLTKEFQPEEIWLFGSHTWGQADDDSDVDLMIALLSCCVCLSLSPRGAR